jgi:hypothetical protein
VSPKSVRSRALAGLGALLIAAACNSNSGPPGPPSISVARYDQDCATIADCVFVYDGPTNCCGVGCANTAIAQRALVQYTSDLASAERAACAGTSGVCSMGGPNGSVVICPGPGRLDCLAGVCVFVRPGDASAAD